MSNLVLTITVMIALVVLLLPLWLLLPILHVHYIVYINTTTAVLPSINNDTTSLTNTTTIIVIKTYTAINVNRTAIMNMILLLLSL